MSNIKVMLVDDSAVIRGLLDRALKADGNFDIVCSASNGQMAVSMLRNHPVDVIVLDIEMPVMDGISALPKLLEIAPKTKIIMASTLTRRNAEISLKALELGATDYVAKPTTKDGAEVNQFYAELITKIKALVPRRGVGSSQPSSSASQPAAVKSTTSGGIFDPIPTPTRPLRPINQLGRVSALAIASSTGGPQALLGIFRQLKGLNLRAPIFITQHMPPNFTTILADHISKASGHDCHEAVNDELVVPGKIYLAPGDYHMTVSKHGNDVRLSLNQNAPENFCRPSADPMMRGLSKIYGEKLLVAVLTGLGSDGARGASEVVQNGGVVVAEDEKTCVVYGMPKAVVEAKLTSAVFPLPEIASFLIPAVS